ncbi:MAG: hypothetical protein AVO35_12230 [Candidatus Aegiribacteria sp. MLS_C]|nr:MAG: hypothetical protein AVO35_12230 [Candidatus Aegiribacteria sp. MLS_C]
MVANMVRITLDAVPLVITGGVVLLLLGLLQLYLGLRAQRGPSVTGEETMVGRTGIVRKAEGFRDRSVVEIRGELWWCIPMSRRVELKEGATVTVVGVSEDSMILEVDVLDS